MPGKWSRPTVGERVDRAEAPAPTDPAEEAAILPTERLESEITRLAGHLAAAECRWLALVAEFDRREAWRAWGCASAVHWLGWQCGIEERAARERIRVARALARFPAIREDFAAGRLSYSKVRAITRIATPRTEAELAGMARHATAAQIERLVAAYRKVFDPDRRAEAAAREQRLGVTWFHDDDGSFVLSARLHPEDGALVRGMIDALTERDLRARPRARGETVAQRRAQALVEMAALAAAARGDGAAGATGTDDGRDGHDEHAERTPLPIADRHLVVLNVDAEVLAGGDGQRCELDGGPGICSDAARRLACDSPRVSIWRGPDGRVLGIGRRRRALPPWLRRLLHARDGGCRFPGCGQRRHVRAHHVTHWAHGGATDLANLIELCAFHHRLVHEGGWRVAFEPASTALLDHPGGARPAVTFVAPDGTRHTDPGHTEGVSPGGSAEPSGGADPSALERDHERRGITIDPTSIVPTWHGDHLDLDLTIDALAPPSPRLERPTPARVGARRALSRARTTRPSP